MIRLRNQSVILLLSLALLASNAWSVEIAPRRISGEILDLGKVHTIYMVPGMATLIEIPTAVTGIRCGNPASVQYFQPEKPDNEVTLVLMDSNAKPTNLIIRSNKKKYVFDIVPSKTVHQDSVEVVGAYGGAALGNSGAQLLDSSQSVGNVSTKVASGKDARGVQ